jgi:sarcosine oxidase delta subunit
MNFNTFCFSLLYNTNNPGFRTHHSLVQLFKVPLTFNLSANTITDESFKNNISHSEWLVKTAFVEQLLTYLRLNSKDYGSEPWFSTSYCSRWHRLAVWGETQVCHRSYIIAARQVLNSIIKR